MLPFPTAKYNPLEPCPFCQSVAVIEEDTECWDIKCTNCSAAMSSMRASESKLSWSALHDTLVAEWNRGARNAVN